MIEDNNKQRFHILFFLLFVFWRSELTLVLDDNDNDVREFATSILFIGSVFEAMDNSLS